MIIEGDTAMRDINKIKTVFAQRLASLRKDKKMKQKDLAAAIGITMQALSRYENAQKLPEVDRVIDIASFFGVTTDYLLGLSDLDFTFINDEENLYAKTILQLSTLSDWVGPIINASRLPQKKQQLIIKNLKCLLETFSQL
jgi:transcriptional regulator with XRE-family HTH domain